MKHAHTFLTLLLLTTIAFGQSPKPDQSICASYFEEIKTATKENYQLWDKDLYAPMLLVDPQTRQVFANQGNSAGVLKKQNGVIAIHSIRRRIQLRICWN